MPSTAHEEESEILSRVQAKESMQKASKSSVNKSGASIVSRMIKMMEGFSQRLSILTAMVEPTQEATGSGGTSTKEPPIPSTSRAAVDWEVHTFNNSTINPVAR